ncbi:MAG: fibronectin type III domain-containing protein [Candidatus Korobacteraceae bacterium]
MSSRYCLLALLGLLPSLVACGLPAAPQPPSLQLPEPVRDLSATRKGDSVQLSWTPPIETTDGQTIRRPGSTYVCRNIYPPNAPTGAGKTIGNKVDPSQCSRIAELPPPRPGASKDRATFTDTLPPEFQRQHATDVANYAVEVINFRGRSAGLSAAVQVPLAPTLPPPLDLQAEVTAEGVRLAWSGMLHEHESPELRHLYRVYRTSDPTASANQRLVVGEVQLASDTGASLLDRNIEWGNTYHYLVTAVTQVPLPQGTAMEVEGEDSAPLAVTPQDTFAPATPTAVEAVFSGPGQPPFIDVVWTPSPDTDLAGYNIDRSTSGQTPTRINRELVLTPSFRDSDVLPGMSYQYFVSAVDVRGNQSTRSEPATETVPQN